MIASGTGNLTYQWSKNGAAISGATSASYTTPATTSADNGAQFSVVVTSSAGGSITSSTATLTVTADGNPPPLLRNYAFSALGGTAWYFQFFFYTMGESQMGRFAFSSWTLHMASIIIFSTMWGWILHEWKGSSKKAHALIAAGIATLVLSTVIIGYGTMLKNH